MRRLRFFAALAAAAMLAAGCGDSDVCGAYSGGNVAVVKPCGTVVVGQGQSVTDGNEPDPAE
jgi:hypothetical protein